MWGFASKETAVPQSPAPDEGTGRILGENIEIYQSGPLLALRQRHDIDTRDADDKLAKPPILLAVIDDGEIGEIRFERVSWRLGEMLSPADHRKIVNQMSITRTIDDRGAAWIRNSTPGELRELAKLIAGALAKAA